MGDFPTCISRRVASVALYPISLFRVRSSAVLAALAAACLAPSISSAQQAGGDSVPHQAPALRFRLLTDPLATPAPLARAWHPRHHGEPLDVAAQSAALERRLEARHGTRLRVPELAIDPAVPFAPVDTALAVAPSPAPVIDENVFEQYTDLGIRVRTRMEGRAQRDHNERCSATDALFPTSLCRGAIQPQFDFQFGVLSGGTVADRIHVNVDYDSQREFEASNTVSLFYAGRPDEVLHRIEVGNVTFAPPPSRFITDGIPIGNYGIQATGQLGPMHFRTIAAQQKGNVVRDRVFTVGDRTVQSIARDIEDFQVERRRFFWVVNPAQTFPDRFPNIDILDRALPSLAASLPSDRRPRRVVVYRYRPPGQTGAVSPDINGPYAHTRGARNPNEVGPYEVLQQGVDYYIDPSNLWLALVTPLQRGERLAVSYTVTGAGGGEVVNGPVGGTVPTTRGAPGRDTVNLLWDGEVLPGDAVFDHEIRSVYRLAGEDLRRRSVEAQIVVGGGSDREKPVSGRGDTYLQLLGLAQSTNPGALDTENRIWPREGDPVQGLGAGGRTNRVIRDHFLVFPSLRPFASNGLVQPPDPVNDSLYRTADEDLVSQRRPPTQYRIRVRYSSEGGGDARSFALGALQIRQGSERLMLDGVPLRRDIDYTIDYELGRVTFLQPDTVFGRQRQLSAQYEENPIFASVPTTIVGFSANFPMQNGQVAFTALSQNQRTTFNRPPLGFEPASTMVAGVSGAFSFESEGVTRALDRLPFVRAGALSRLDFQGEFATSRPRATGGGIAYIESFEGEGGINIGLQEQAWRLGSRPGTSGAGLQLGGGTAFDFPLDNATTLAWQNTGLAVNQAGQLQQVQFYSDQIDSVFSFTAGQGLRFPELVLWNTLYPRGTGGMLAESPWRYRWSTGGGPVGRRWRSITQLLDESGADLSRVEHLEFYALVDTAAGRRDWNPMLVFDFGDVSENTVAFAPESLFVGTRTITGPDGSSVTVENDSLFTGRRLRGYDRLNTERDPVTRSFDASVNDRGLPQDVADTLVVREGAATRIETGVPLCNRSVSLLLPLGDARNNCTVGNRRLDEEDLDLDGLLNLTDAQRNNERLIRYVIDTRDAAQFNRVGRCFQPVPGADADDPMTGLAAGGTLCWVHFRVPFTAPTERLNEPLVRRIRAMRLTMVTSPQTPDSMFVRVPLARLRLVGSPWVKRAERALTGIGGTRTDGNGFVIASVIGTQDRDPVRGVRYESPPGVTDLPDERQAEFTPGQIQINERSLRLIAGDVPVNGRAEAYYRFPEGDRNFMSYEELRLWARGVDKGWGAQGDLQFFVKIGRDADNFYAYRTPVNSGPTRDAWLPEVRVEFSRLYALRARLQNAYLRGDTTALGCTGLDASLVDASEIPAGGTVWAACDGGYIVYSANPGVSPPNLAAVQEMSVGMLRVANAGQGSGGFILPTDSLELWVDDIRLRGTVSEAGYAGHLGVGFVASDIASFQATVSRRDGHFRQLAQAPTYTGTNDVALSATVRLDRFLPSRLGVALPFTASYIGTGTDPLFLSRSDIAADAVAGLRTPRSSAAAYTLGARLSEPVDNPLLGAVVNNLAVTSTYQRAVARSEFQASAASAFNGEVMWALAPASRRMRMGWLDELVDAMPSWARNSGPGRALRGAAFRWSPAQLRFASGFATTDDERNSYTLPVALGTDTARVVRGLSRVWRNTGGFELRPFESLSASWTVISLRDLRDYGGLDSIAMAARDERGRLAGLDVGLERERQMTAHIGYAPTLFNWLRPRLDLSSSFTLFRDPNARSLARNPAGGDGRLPRRFGNQQGIGLTADVDIPRALAPLTGDSSFVARTMRRLQPLGFTMRRDLRSNFDGAADDPGLGFQLGLGTVGDFRSLGRLPATSAGETHTLAANQRIVLPHGLSLVSQYARTDQTSWVRLTGTDQLPLDVRSETFPDAALQWTWRPRTTNELINSIGGQARFAETRSESTQPFIGGTGEIRAEQLTRQYPVNASVMWGILGGFSSGAGYNHRTTRELRSGGVSTQEANDVTVDLGKAFIMPRGLLLGGEQMRTRVAFQQSDAQTWFISDAVPRRIADNGRWSITGNADADINENATFSMTLSRVITFDRNADRRFSQTLLSVVFNLQFFSGELR